MALIVFSTDIENIDSTVSNGSLIDLTNYANQGVARNTLAVVVFLVKRDALNNDTSITINNSSPLTATSWSFALPPQDGLFVANLYGFIIWSAGTYTLNQIVYYNGNFYYANAASVTDTPGSSDWTLIPVANIQIVIAGLSPAPSNLSQTQTYNFTTPHIQTGILATTLADFGLLVTEGKPRNWSQASGVLSGGSLLKSAYTNFAKQNYTGAQSIVDYLQAITQQSI
jgi:hypothetical protein